MVLICTQYQNQYVKLHIFLIMPTNTNHKFIYIFPSTIEATVENSTQLSFINLIYRNNRLKMLLKEVNAKLSEQIINFEDNQYNLINLSNKVFDIYINQLLDLDSHYQDLRLSDRCQDLQLLYEFLWNKLSCYYNLDKLVINAIKFTNEIKNPNIIQIGNYKVLLLNAYKTLNIKIRNIKSYIKSIFYDYLTSNCDIKNIDYLYSFEDVYLAGYTYSLYKEQFVESDNIFHKNMKMEKLFNKTISNMKNDSLSIIHDFINYLMDNENE